MSTPTSTHRHNLQLEKLGIREIRQRIEVSPIITDPNIGGMDRADSDSKSYSCTIGLPSLPQIIGGR